MARPANLLSVEDARERILARFDRLPAERASLEEAAGRILAEPVHSGMTLPPFANASMDGFALIAAETAHASRVHPAMLTVRQHIPAGATTTRRLAAGEAARIMTGAPLPAGADAVVPFEEVEQLEGEIVVFAPVPAGACVRPAGQDVKPGVTVLQPGAILGARQIALLAALGRGTVWVTRRPVAAILSTGDELVAPGTILRPGQIYDSNTPMLTAAVLEAGAIPRPLPATGDDPAAIGGALSQATGCDLLITCGGASVGDFDHVKSVIGAQGSIGFWRVRVRPGKPLIFGSIGDTPIIGLPGNPTSAMVTFEEFVRPALRTMLGAPPLRPEIEVTLDERIDNRGGRRTYARVRLERRGGRFNARLSGPQDSAMILPLARADGLLIVPEDRDEMSPGETATVQVWRLPE